MRSIQGQDFRGASRTPIYSIRQESHFGVSALAGMVSGGVRQGVYLPDGIQDGRAQSLLAVGASEEAAGSALHQFPGFANRACVGFRPERQMYKLIHLLFLFFSRAIQLPIWRMMIQS